MHHCIKYYVSQLWHNIHWCYVKCGNYAYYSFCLLCMFSPVPSLVVVVKLNWLLLRSGFTRSGITRCWWFCICRHLSRARAHTRDHPTRTIIRAKVRHTRVYAFTKSLHYIIHERKGMTFVCERERERHFYLKNKIHFKLTYHRSKFLRNERSLFLNM